MPTDSEARREAIKTYLKSDELVCRFGRVEASNSKKTHYEILPSINDPERVIIFLRTAIKKIVAEGQNSLVLIGEAPETTSLLDDIIYFRTLMHLLAIIEKQDKFIMEIIKEAESRDSHPELVNPKDYESIVEKLKNPEMQMIAKEIIKAQFKKSDDGDDFDEVFQDLNKQLRKMDFNNSLSLAEQRLRTKNMYTLANTKYFIFAMTPLLPNHPRYSPERLIVFNRSDEVDKRGPTKMADRIREESTNLANTQGYPVYHFSGGYPYYSLIRGEEIRAVSTLINDHGGKKPDSNAYYS